MSDTAVARFTNELTSMQRLLVQQRAVLSSDQHTKLMDTQSNTFVQKSAGLRGITADEVSELTGIIQSGPWHSDQQSRIVLALTTIMSDGDADADAKHGRRKNQDLEHFYNWLTSDEGSTLSTTNDMRLKIATALDVLVRIKATLLKETSKRHVLAVICSLGMSAKTGQSPASVWRVRELRSWFLYFKRHYAARFKDRRGDMHILMYPEHPSMLTDDKYHLMYEEGNPPAPLKIDSDLVSRIEDAIWCRGNALALRDDDDHIVSADTQHVHSTSASSSTAANMQHMMTMMMSMMQQQQCRSNTQDVDIELLQPMKRSKAIASPQTGRPVRSASLLQVDDAVPIDAAYAAGCNAANEEVKSIQDGVPDDVHTPETPVSKLKLSSGMTPEQQAARFLRTMKGCGDAGTDDDNDEDDDATLKVKSKPAAKGNVGKTDKAKPKPKAKTKAGGTPMLASMQTKLKVPGWSIARRLKEYPKGCPKCRGATGCTRSCFKYRGQIADE